MAKLNLITVNVIPQQHDGHCVENIVQEHIVSTYSALNPNQADDWIVCLSDGRKLQMNIHNYRTLIGGE